MADRYDHQAIEKKWQDKWTAAALFKAADSSAKPKTYVLDMFPYPSGEGLHVGHPKGYIATDIYSRHMRMRGHNVLHPMGWDAFGLPAENFALKNKVHPRVAVEQNIANFKAQLAHIGFDYDWSREINTTDPAFYKWTQWVFLKMFEKGLAFQSNEPINWCPSCMTGLANEDLDGDVCERCGTKVEKKSLPQWVLKITDYADRMLEDLSLLRWPEYIKEAQRNWIGRSEGAELEFALTTGDSLKVFTTRPDTLFGATYMVIAPEHALAAASADEEVKAYVARAQAMSEIERMGTKEKTGVELRGVRAINPATKKEIPIFVADYVLGGYGTGAIMAVPDIDERDGEFARAMGLPITETKLEDPKKIVEMVGGKRAVTYKLKDWVFSRQRYWGEPIPIIHCPKDGAVGVPEKDLPVLLPEVSSYEPSGTGESPLANIADWVNTTCPTCGGPAKRETNTMPQWAGSSWYYLRFMDPANTEALVGKDKEKYWAPVDVYVGGDHAVRHLIYARFWHKFLFDIGAVSTAEPFARLEFLGFILAEDGRKMSKRYGNVIDPTEVVLKYGADTFRVYEMFMGPFENTVAWSTKSLAGSQRFIERVWKLSDRVSLGPNQNLSETLLHQTIKKVSDDIEAFKFNTAVSQMMIFLNAAEEGGLDNSQWNIFLRLLAPFAPHLTEELWQRAGGEGSIHAAEWPIFDPAKLVEDTIVLGVQVNGKLRGTVEISSTATQEEAVAAAKANEAVAKWLGRSEAKIVYVPGKILSFSYKA